MGEILRPRGIYGNNCVPLQKILKTMAIPNIWTKPTNVSELRGNLGTILRFSGILELKQNSDSIVTELIKLARSNESILRKYIK